jgi:hypothetical protein
MRGWGLRAWLEVGLLVALILTAAYFTANWALNKDTGAPQAISPAAPANWR